MFRAIFEPRRFGWPMRITATIAALFVLSPTIFGLFIGDVFYALVEWPLTLLIMGTAMGPGRRVYAFFEFKLRRRWLGWRQGPGTVRTLVVLRKPMHPAVFMIGVASYPAAVAWNAVRETHSEWWPQFAGLCTAALLLLVAHWEFKAERDDAAQVDREIHRRLS